MTISRSDRKVLVGVLVFLILLIIGLAGAVIVNIVTRKNSDEVKENTVSVIAQVQSDISEMTVDEAEEYFEEKLEEYQDTEYEFYIKIAQIYKFLDANFGGKALYVAEQMDVDFMDEKEKMDYYLALSDIYTKLDEPARASEYEDLYWKMYLKIYNGGAGGN